MTDTQPTEPLPDPNAQWVLSLPPAEPRKRRPVWPWIVSAVAVLALMVVAWFVAEWIAKDFVTKSIRTLIVTQLALPEDQEVDVTVEGMVLPQLISGTLDEVTVASDDVAIGPTTGDVTVHAQGIPIRADAPAEAGSASVRLDADQLKALLSSIEGFPADSVELAEPDVTMSTELSLFGLAVPIGVSLTPGVNEGDLVLTPAGFQIADAEFTAEGLRDQFGALADAVLRDWTVCIADDLPAGVTLSSVAVQGDELVVDLTVDGRIITDPALQAKGTCS